MDLLNLGSQSRKTGLKPKVNTKKDKYNMEDLDDFFNEDDEIDQITSRKSMVTSQKDALTPRSELGKSNKESIDRLSDRSTKRTSLVRQSLTKSIKNASTNFKKPAQKHASPIEAVARKLDFNNSMPFPPVTVSSKSENLKRSPLLSPLQDNNNYEDDFMDNGFDDGLNDDLDLNDNNQNLSPPHEIEKPKEMSRQSSRSPSKSKSSKVQERLNAQQEAHKKQYLQELQEFGESDEEIPPTKTVKNSKPKKSEGSSITKKMALGKPVKPANKKKRKSPSPEASPELEPEPILASDSEELSIYEKSVESPQEIIPSDSDDDRFAKSKKLKRLTQNPPSTRIGKSIQKQETVPPEQQGLRRSSRQRVEPLAFWRNERIVYTRAHDADTPVQEIKAVVHVPEPTRKPIRRTTHRTYNSRTSSKTRSTPRYNEIEYKSDPEVSGSEWFKEGNLEIEVYEGTGSDNRTQRRIAWAPGKESYSKPSNPKNGDNFKVAILFDENRDFAASGMLEIPFNGLKSLKNTDDTYFIFHVVQGLLEVSLSGSNFVVSGGCSFEVPMGNFYEFKNLGKSVARLFFVQSKYVTVEAEEDWDN